MLEITNLLLDSNNNALKINKQITTLWTIITYEARTRLGGCHIEVWHGPTRGVASDVVARASVPRLSFFFFFTDSRRLDLIRTNSALFCIEPGRFGQNQAILAESGRMGQWSKHIKIAEIGLESCQNSRNQLWMRPKHPKSVIL